jgi:membrane protease YdiL (CAAX protease family)
VRILEPDWATARVGSAATVIVLVLLAYLLVGEPLLGRWQYARLRRRQEAGDPQALLAFFRLTTVFQISLLVVTVAALIASPGLTPAAIGLRLPDPGAVWPTVGWTAYLLVVLAFTGFLQRRRALRGGKIAGQSAFIGLLPRTPAERRAAARVAVGAGVAEEIAFRGLLLTAAWNAFPAVPAYLVALLMVLLFALDHLYQGWLGLVGTGVVGFLVTTLYLLSGSLLPSILVHVALDLRSLLLVPEARPTNESGGAPEEPPAGG